MKKDSLGDRMKGFYEGRSQTFLTRRVPVIVRIDGKAFHTFCKRFTKPYDEFLNASLNEVMLSLCKRVQGVKMAERHSDEISLVLVDYDTIDTDSFFDYNVQKICSVVSSIATAEFIKQLLIGQEKLITDDMKRDTLICQHHLDKPKSFWYNQCASLLSTDEAWPNFDARCFNIPKEDVSNYFYWRLLDCKRNSISMLAQSLFSSKQLHGKTCDQMQEMMFQEKGINWNDIPQGQKSGFIALKQKEMKLAYSRGPMDAHNGTMVERNIWKTQPGPKTKSELDAIISCIIEPKGD